MWPYSRMCVGKKGSWPFFFGLSFSTDSSKPAKQPSTPPKPPKNPSNKHFEAAKHKTCTKPYKQKKIFFKKKKKQPTPSKTTSKNPKSSSASCCFRNSRVLCASKSSFEARGFGFRWPGLWFCWGPTCFILIISSRCCLLALLSWGPHDSVFCFVS